MGVNTVKNIEINRLLRRSQRLCLLYLFHRSKDPFLQQNYQFDVYNKLNDGSKPMPSRHILWGENAICIYVTLQEESIDHPDITFTNGQQSGTLVMFSFFFAVTMKKLLNKNVLSSLTSLVVSLYHHALQIEGGTKMPLFCRWNFQIRLNTFLTTKYCI